MPENQEDLVYSGDDFEGRWVVSGEYIRDLIARGMSQ